MLLFTFSVFFSLFEGSRAEMKSSTIHDLRAEGKDSINSSFFLESVTSDSRVNKKKKRFTYEIPLIFHQNHFRDLWRKRKRFFHLFLLSILYISNKDFHMKLRSSISCTSGRRDRWMLTKEWKCLFYFSLCKSKFWDSFPTTYLYNGM